MRHRPNRPFPPRLASWPGGCALFVAAVLFGAGLLEIVLRTFGHQPLQVHAERTNFWAYHPTFGWHHRPDQQGYVQLGDERIAVRFNGRGLRDRDYPDERVADKNRILVLGDSFAWGYGVAQEETFSERLEATLPDVEVINAGVSGYSTDQELRWLEAEGLRYQPDLVILTMAGNDDTLNRRSIAYFVYPKPFFLLGTDGALELRNVPVPRASLSRRVAYQVSRRSALLKLAVDRSAQLARRARRPTRPGIEAAASGAPKPAEPFALTVALVERIRRAAAGGGARLLLVTTPMYSSPDAPGTYAEFLITLRARGLQVLDVEALEGFSPEAMRLPNDGHWNSTGHAFVAARLTEMITEQALLD
ncbi:MAG: GDSL-type esterase/lipase family protein [Acidobacteriota bacterium]